MKRKTVKPVEGHLTPDQRLEKQLLLASLEKQTAELRLESMRLFWDAAKRNADKKHGPAKGVTVRPEQIGIDPKIIQKLLRKKRG